MWKVIETWSFGLVLTSLLIASSVPSVHAQETPKETEEIDNESAEVDEEGSDEERIVFKPEYLFEWLKREGGYINRNIGFGDDGLIALEDIAPGQVLLTVPADTVFLGHGSIEFLNVCDTAWHVAMEHILEEESSYYPYTQFLLDYSHMIGDAEPVTIDWSTEGKRWIRGLVGPELEPTPFGDLGTALIQCRDETLSEILEGEEASHLLPQALTTIANRGWNKLLIPIYDLVERNPERANIMVDESGELSNTVDRKSVGVVATRKIPQGESLYTSYDSAASYFNLFGKVQPYPRRWVFQTGYEGHIYGSKYDVAALFFEIDKTNDEKYHVTWMAGEPNRYQVNWFHSQVKRLKTFHVTDADVPDQNERERAQAFQEALITDLEQAIIWAHGDPYEDELSLTCGAPASEDQTEAEQKEGTCQTEADRYDDLGFRPDTLDYNTGVHFSCSNPVSGSDIFDSTRSHYQAIEWAQIVNPNSQKLDTCLLLDDILHSCTSIRPQVHEPIMHYPSSFLDEVKRVLFVGGGDLIILHEILKYPSLELVVGLELDQTVVRSSFRMYGVQPHFDDRRVKWWFGDASKSLALLPEEYFGTFDLVFIDLLATIFDTLRVEGVLLADYMMKLLKPDGILVRQEDFVSHTVVDFAEHTLEYAVTGVPYICQQSFTMGSNGIDFTKKERIDHKIDTIYFNVDESNHTSIWSGMSKNKRRVPKSPPTAQEENSEETSGDKGRYGVLVVIEAEDIDSSAKDSSTFMNAISIAIRDSGLTELSTETSKSESFQSFVYVLQEGYVVARIWPEHNYCAFDLQLWNNIDKHQSVAAQLVAAVGGDLERSTSSFQITTGGMFGLPLNKHKQGGSSLRQDDLTVEEPASSGLLSRQKYDAVLREMTSSLSHESAANVAVICPDESVLCKSLDTFSEPNDSNTKVFPIRACPILPQGGDLGASENLEMVACEQQVRQSLQAATVTGKIGGIVVDPKAPLAMGQLVHKVFNNTLTRGQLLSESFLVLVPIEEQEEASWRHELLERFRIEMLLYNPVFLSNVLFKSGEGMLKVELLHFGDKNYHARLLDCLAKIQQSSSINYEVVRLKDGLMNHLPGFIPEKVTMKEEYNLESATEQWMGQRPLGQQNIYQFEVIPSLVIKTGDHVMMNVHVATLSGIWTPGRVIAEKRGGNFELRADIDRERFIMNRSRIRIIDDYTAVEPLNFGEHVFRKEDEARYTQAMVVEVKDNDMYMVQEITDGTVFPAHRNDLFRATERPIIPELPAMSCSDLETVIQDILRTLGPREETIDVSSVRTTHLGDGCLLVAFVKGGAVVASWDGRIHVDVNVFMENASPRPRQQTKTVVEKGIANLRTVQHDSQPRGYGRVVNSFGDMQSIWFGQLQSELPDEEEK